MRLCLAAALVLLCGACDSQSCNTQASDVGDACIPDAIAPGTETVIEVRELCSQACALRPGCTASLVNGQVTLDFHVDVCSQSTLFSCQAALCVQPPRTAPCKLPALRVGDYTLVAPGNFNRLLRVRAGGQGSCILPTSTQAAR